MKIKSIKIKNLFGRFDYFFSFDSSENNLFMFHGHNGAGKTKILSIIDTLCKRNFSALSALYCDAVELVYEDGTTLFVKKSLEGTKGNKTKNNNNKNNNEKSETFDVSIRDAKGKLTKAPLVYNDPQRGKHSNSRRLGSGLSYIERAIPYLTRIDMDKWMDVRSSTEYSLTEICENFAGDLPSSLIADIRTLLVYDVKGLPLVKTSFINTRRLDYINLQRTRQQYNVYDSEESEAPKNPLIVLSESVAKMLTKSLEQYATTSQKLDSAFPESILRPDFVSLTPEKGEVLIRLEALTDKAQKLYEAGILEQQEKFMDDTMNHGSIDERYILSVLSHYCSNTEAKLEVFDDIYSRIDLLTDIINKRYKFKKLKVNKSGFVITDIETNNTIPLEALSSGEQHELYLFADLIFADSVADLIFIDEPEISLHVEWQTSFVDDLLRIESLKESQIFIATHSPSVINNHWEKAFDLNALQKKTK